MTLPRATGLVHQSPGSSRREVQLSLSVRRDLAWSAEETAALDALVNARPQVGAFLTPAWLAGFFAQPPPGAELSILVLREQGALRGVVPVAIRRMLSRVSVTLLGGGAGSDRVDLLAARGYEARFADMFLDWLEDSFGPAGFVLELRDVPGDSALWGAIRRTGMEQKLPLTLVPREVYVLPYLNLDERCNGSIGDPSAAFASKSSRQHRRALERRGPLKVNILQDRDDVLCAFDDLVRLLHARWGDGSALADPRVRRFHRSALPLLLRDRRLRMIRLTAGARPIAVFYGLAAGSWWGYYLAGYDRQWAGRIRLGQMMLATAIDLSSQDGAVEFDFLKGAERIKYHWLVRERVTLDADVYSGKSGAQLHRATRAMREAAGALARTATGIVTSRDRG
jgi:CelD/BcsL family acetyltransferase involved in cellulose biosynthesis